MNPLVTITESALPALARLGDFERFVAGGLALFILASVVMLRRLNAPVPRSARPTRDSRDDTARPEDWKEAA